MKRAPEQLDLLGATAPSLPDGIVYHPDILTVEEEQLLAREIAQLDLKPFAFQGFLGNRRTASFGWRYDFNGGGFQKAEELPEQFLPWRERAAVMAGVDAESLEHLLVTEYAPGAGIGWHRDRPQFGIVAALSLLAPCRMRFRRERDGGWERRHVMLEPRSGYVLAGEGREVWEHSIPPVDQLRYSLTFRTLKRSGSGASRRVAG